MTSALDGAAAAAVAHDLAGCLRPGRASGRGRSRTARSGRSSGSRLAVGVFARRFSHSLSSLRNEPSAQTILLQRSPSTLKPCSQISGQTRAGLSLMASSASRLASLTSNFVPACLLNNASERCDAAFHSPSAAAVRQPTRRNSLCTDFTSSACGGPGFSEARLVPPAAVLAVAALFSGALSAATVSPATRLRSASAACCCATSLAFSAARRACSAALASASAFACCAFCAPSAASRVRSCSACRAFSVATTRASSAAILAS